TTPVDPHGNQRHAGALSYIWTAGKLQEEVAVQNGARVCVYVLSTEVCVGLDFVVRRSSVLSAPKDVR
ncbi:hypothetical protein EXIGLDRAFT_782415, partial [Exidia glandulosa HHB12029]